MPCVIYQYLVLVIILIRVALSKTDNLRPELYLVGQVCVSYHPKSGKILSKFRLSQMIECVFLEEIQPKFVNCCFFSIC